MSNKVVLVTGASNGFGNELITIFKQNNYDVVINYLSDKESAENLQKNIHKYGGKSLIIKADITNEVEVKNLIEKTIDEFGKIDVLINHAATASDNDIYDKSKEEFLKVLSVNVLGTFLVTKEASKYMNNGTIINISSSDAIDTYNSLSMDYCASKAAINSLTKTIAMRFPNLNVYAVAPNWINTNSTLNMNPDFLNSELKRINQKELIDKDWLAKEVYNLTLPNKYQSGNIIIIRDNKEVTHEVQ